MEKPAEGTEEFFKWQAWMEEQHAKARETAYADYRKAEIKENEYRAALDSFMNREGRKGN